MNTAKPIKSTMPRIFVMGLIAMFVFIFSGPLSNRAALFDFMTNNATAAVQTNTLTTFGGYDAARLAQAPVGPTDGPGSKAVASSCAAGGGYQADSSTVEAANMYLPVDRWSGKIASQHTRLSSGTLGTDNLFEKIQRNGTISGLFSIGNGAWGLGSSLTQNSSRFCLADTAGVTVDKLAGGLGTALLNSGLVAFLGIVTIIGLLFKAMSGKRPGREFMRLGVVLGLLGILITGANRTTTGRGGEASFGVGSPGWFASATNKTVTALSNEPAKALNDYMTTNNPFVKNPSEGTCKQYIETLINYYDSSMVGYSSATVVPKSLNSMWMKTGLKAYSDAQFGMNKYAGKSYCHLVDKIAGIPANTADQSFTSGSGVKINITTIGRRQIANAALSGQTTISAESPTDGSPNDPITKDSKVYMNNNTNDDEDIAMVAWAACKYTGVKGGWKAEEAWKKLGDHSVDDAACNDYFRTDKGSDKFNWDADPGKIDEAVKDAGTEGPVVADFLHNLHGDSASNGGAVAISGAYALSSIIVGLVFSLLAGAIFVAKLGLLALTLLAIFVVVSALVPGASGNQLSKLSSQYIGMAVLAFGASMLISFVALLTSFIQSAGTSAVGGGMMSIVWTALAPIAAIFILHQTITKVFKAPSPFKPSGALAFGGAAAGGMLGAGIVERMENRAKGAALNTGGRASAIAAAGAKRAAGVRPKVDSTDRVGGMEAIGAEGKTKTGTLAAMAGDTAAAATGSTRVRPGETNGNNVTIKDSIVNGAIEGGSFPKGANPLLNPDGTVKTDANGNPLFEPNESESLREKRNDPTASFTEKKIEAQREASLRKSVEMTGSTNRDRFRDAFIARPGDPRTGARVANNALINREKAVFNRIKDRASEAHTALVHAEKQNGAKYALKTVGVGVAAAGVASVIAAPAAVVGLGAVAAYGTTRGVRGVKGYAAQRPQRQAARIARQNHEFQQHMSERDAAANATRAQLAEEIRSQQRSGTEQQRLEQSKAEAAERDRKVAEAQAAQKEKSARDNIVQTQADKYALSEPEPDYPEVEPEIPEYNEPEHVENAATVIPQSTNSTRIGEPASRTRLGGSERPRL